MNKVFLVFEVYRYSEEDHSTDVLRVFSSKNDADAFSSFMNANTKDKSFVYYVVSYNLF